MRTLSIVLCLSACSLALVGCDEGDPKGEGPSGGDTGGGGTPGDDDCDNPTPFYADGDGDGFGDADSSVEACDAPTGYVTDATDCDDAEASAYPGADEVCDDVDNDCDGTVDNDDALDASTWYADADTDGYGNGDTTTTACEQPSGYVDNADDCNDDEALAYTGALSLIHI